MTTYFSSHSTFGTSTRSLRTWSAIHCPSCRTFSFPHSLHDSTRLTKQTVFSRRVKRYSASGPEKMSTKRQIQEAEILEPLDLGVQTSILEEALAKWEELPSRYRLLTSAFVSFVVCNMDKVNLSVAIIPMAQEYGWNATVSGLVQSAFFYGYMLFQLPGGYLSTKFTGSRMLPTGVGLWSFATFTLPFVGGSLLNLGASRGLVGVGEALAPAAAADVIAKMIPEDEKSRAVVFVNSGLYVGTIMGLLVSPVLIDAFGWRSVFYVFGGVGLLWVLGWELLVEGLKTKDPETYNKIRRTTENKMSSKENESIPWRGMIRSRPVQALMYAHFCSGWFHFSILSWLPSYFSSTLGLSLGDASRFALMPPIAGITISSFAGPLADSLISRGWKRGVVRKLSQCTAFVGPTLCLLAASFSDSSEQKIALLTASIGLGSFCLPGLYSNSQDLSPKYAGFILSMTTTMAALPGIVGVPVTGAILDATNSWPLALFAPSMLMMISGAFIFGFFGGGEVLEFEDNRPLPIEKFFKRKLKEGPLFKKRD